MFAYDNEQTLSLNSCNLLIPKFDDLCAKYILAVLNSRTAQYYFQKTFDSIKVLRSHLEQIPIPYATKDTQDTLVRYVDIMLDAQNASSTEKAYEELDQKIAQLYNLTSDEYLNIKSELSADKLYM